MASHDRYGLLQLFKKGLAGFETIWKPSNSRGEGQTFISLYNGPSLSVGLASMYLNIHLGRAHNWRASEVLLDKTGRLFWFARKAGSPFQLCPVMFWGSRDGIHDLPGSCAAPQISTNGPLHRFNYPQNLVSARGPGTDPSMDTKGPLWFCLHC